MSARSGKRIGVIELIAYTVASEWAALVGVPRLKRQFYAVMPQVISVWCRQLGHRVTYTTYYGQCDPESLLPDDLDIVFIAATTQASALAYALARLYRRRGVITVIGGPHAKSFAEDCARFFDVTVKDCDRNLLADILAGRFAAPAILDSDRMPESFPGVEERLPEIAVSAFHQGRPMRSSVISLWASVGCPYSCSFCTDWNSVYMPAPVAQLEADLTFVADHFPGTILGFQDPNFGIRFDQTMDLLERVPEDRRSPYLMQCSLSVLTSHRLNRLAVTNCFYIAPGVESWTAFGNKTGLAGNRGSQRVAELARRFADLHVNVPGLQANFVMGLDGDEGDEPFELTKEFLARVPYVWPNINIVTPYGGTPLYDQMLRESRLLAAMPLALYCSPYLPLVLRNYDAATYYDSFIRLLEASTSLAISLRRAALHDGLVLKLARLGQTIAVRRDIAEMRLIATELRTDPSLRAFHAGRRSDLPEIYRAQLRKRLGRYSELLGPQDLMPVPASSTPAPRIEHGRDGMAGKLPRARHRLGAMRAHGRSPSPEIHVANPRAPAPPDALS